jgi:hypothetical protein
MNLIFHNIIYLCKVYSLVKWKQNSAAPKAPHDIPNLALFKQPKGPLRPLTVMNILFFGTLTLSNKIIPVSLALKENFPSILGIDIPSYPYQEENL